MKDPHFINGNVDAPKGSRATWIWTAVICASALTALADSSPKNTTAASVFVLPANPKDGRDPFFPMSNRPFEAAAAANPHVADVTSLVVKGISGPPGHRLVIINNHTFAEGDEGDVLTTEGRMRVRCIEISEKSVMVEISGQRHMLTNTGGN